MKLGSEITQFLVANGVPIPEQERSRETFARILRAALECLAEVGYRNATTEEVARRAKISHGGLFKRFPSKIVLMATLMGQLEETAREVALANVTEDLLRSDTRVRTGMFVDLYWGFVQTDECKAIEEIWEESRFDAKLRDVLRPFLAYNVSAGDLGMLFPEVRPGVEIQFLSQMIYASLGYLAHNHNLGVDDDAPAKLALLADLVAQAVDRLRE